MIVATPDHGRVLPCIHACQAGKDIYAEKPLTLYIREGRVLVQAVRKYGRVLQVGIPAALDGDEPLPASSSATAAWARSAESRPSTTRAQVASRTAREPIPEGLDWDMWLGQARVASLQQPASCRLDGGGATTPAAR